jgi:hypothetical protein
MKAKAKARSTTKSAPRAQRVGAALHRAGAVTGRKAAVAGRAVGTFFANFWRGLKHG